MGPKPDAYFAQGTTIVDADWLNAIQEELAYAIEQSPGTPALDKTDRTQLKTAIEAYIAAAGGLGTSALYHIVDEKTSGTGGGTGSGGTWNKRTLNTARTANISGASLSSSVVTLPAGTYWIEGNAPVHTSNAEVVSKLRLRQTSVTAATLILGDQSRINGDNVTNVRITDKMSLSGLVVLADTEDIELQQWLSATDSNTLGYPATTGENEVYAEIKIWKVA